MSWSRSKLWRRIEDAALGRLRGRSREALFTELRANPQARADYDLAFEALRELERTPVSQAEFDVVETWLLADLEEGEETEAAAGAWWQRPWLGAVFALAAAAVLVVALRPAQLGVEDGFAARGAGDDRGLAIDALCPVQSGPLAAREGLVPAAEHGCALDGTLSFAYRVDPTVAAGTLSLFGVAADGSVLYYAPTPADAAGLQTRAGTWTPLPMVVRLDVNHEAGPVVLYGLLASRVPTVSEVDALAAALAQDGAFTAGSRIGADPWHIRLAEDSTLANLCSESHPCQSAELTFTIAPARP